MTRIIIHIGTEKTGTTSIQKCLSENRQVLLEHNIVYPHIGKRGDAHFDLVNAIHPLDNNGRHMEFLPPVTHEANFFWDKLAEVIEKNKGKTIVLSAEHFSSRLRHKGLGFMKAFFEKIKIQPEILVYLRPQDEYIESSYSTQIKSGDSKEFKVIFSSYRQQPFRYDYMKLLDLWSEYFGKKSIKVIPYQKDVIGEDIRINILSFIGFNVDKLDELNLSESHLNLKWNNSLLELARLTNAHCKNLKAVERKEFFDLFKVIIPSVFPPSADFNSRLMSSEQIIEVREFYKESNDLVAKSYLDNQSELFIVPSANNSDNEPQTVNPINKPQLVKMLVELYRRLKNN